MRVLSACEYSGATRDRFLALGHDAMSCDLLPTDVPGPHHQGDVLEILDEGWDLILAFPPCTYLTCSAEWAYKDHQTKNIKPGTLIGAARRQAREEALDFVRALLNAPAPFIALENPVGVISSRIRKPDQIIQPWHFGHYESKSTCLWLKGLPPLEPTDIVQKRTYACLCGYRFEEACGAYGCANCCGDSGPAKLVWDNQTYSGQNRLPPSENRWKIRSDTYAGVAAAMAQQWSDPSTFPQGDLFND